VGQIIALLVWAPIFVTQLSGCLTEGSGNEGGTEIVGDPSNAPAPPLTPPERTLCDPFNTGGTAADRGLVGNLVYLEDSQPRYTSARQYIENGTPVQSTIYLDKLFIPTRRFDLGFFTQDGTLVLNSNNQPLYEYFGVRMESELQIAATEPEGWYQLSTLSDDGSVVSLKNTDGSLSPLVSSDGNHPTRMGCATKSIYMTRGQKVPIVLEYYQGPRYHISMVLMWRPLPAGADPNAAVSDIQCGQQGNSMYFDYNTVPSTPTPTYYDLLTRGWKPLENENYHFPAQASNPCAAEDIIQVSNFTIDSSTRDSVTVSWVTNVPGTSQVEVKNVISGVVVSSPLVTARTTSHTVTVSGLSSNTLYAVRGISTSAVGDTASSDERAFRTPR
jgi:hypothetical protein